MTLEQLLTIGTERLQKCQVPEAELNAWYLLQAVLSEGDDLFRRSDYFLRRGDEASEEVKERYLAFVERREQRIPLEYITGYTEFMGLVFCVNEHVLIPRQDTEILVEHVLSECRGKRVLDLCTGSGCIGLSIGTLGNPSAVMLSDISEGACQVASCNELRLRKKEGLDAPVEIVCGNLWEPIVGTFDVIVSNPPYIESEVIPTLMPEVQHHEPMSALDGGEDGLDFYRKIVEDAPKYLNPGGILCFEIGYNQGKSVAMLMKEKKFHNVEIIKDLAGFDRVVSGRLEEFDV